MSTKPFTAALKERAWHDLTTAITYQLLRTPGEYDVVSLVDRVAGDMRDIHKVSYTKVADYLEARYDA